MKKKPSVCEIDKSCVALINQQINHEIAACYTYRSLYCYFAQQSVDLVNVAQFFKVSSDEELEHADLFIDYLLNRGALVDFKDIKAPAKLSKLSLQKSLEIALEAEEFVFSNIKKLYVKAEQSSDWHLAGFLDEHFISEQVDADNKLRRILTQCKRFGSGYGEALFDAWLKDQQKEV